MKYFVLILLIGLVLWGVVALANWGRSRLDSNRRDAVDSRQALRVATKALRLIASDTAGNPVLTAQVALDEIESKELN